MLKKLKNLLDTLGYVLQLSFNLKSVPAGEIICERTVVITRQQVVEASLYPHLMWCL